MPDFLEFALRGGAATTFLLLILILLRDGRNRTLTLMGVLFCYACIFWSLNTPELARALGWSAPLVVGIAHCKAAAFWLFAHALFDDGFRMRPFHWAVLLGMMVLGGIWVGRTALGLATEPFKIPHQLAQIVLAGAAAWIAWKGRGADLVEPRRRARIAFVLLSSLSMIGVTLTYIAHGRPPPIIVDLNVIRLFIMGLGMAYLISGLRSAEMFAPAGAAKAPAANEGAGAPDGADASEARLLSTLERLMTKERIYREAGLTIGALALSVGAPEYVLRRLINGRLGYRNFNAYLNDWRLADAKASLRDPTQRTVPISTIALDAGFSSLGPFNRAFKAAEGMTPSEFRDLVLSEQASPILKSG